MSTKGLLVIISCGSQKIWDKLHNFGPCPAWDVYTGAPFTVNRRFAEKCADKYMILSAKFGYIEPDFVIPENYNVTFKDPSTKPVTTEVLIRQIKEKKLCRYPTVIGLGGKEYRALIHDSFAVTGKKVLFPFAGKGRIGEIMSQIKIATSNCPSFIDSLIPAKPDGEQECG